MVAHDGFPIHLQWESFEISVVAITLHLLLCLLHSIYKQRAVGEMPLQSVQLFGTFGDW